MSDDFDEYFTDDIVFDEKTLAALDLEEQKFLSQHSAKRQKVDVGWKPRPGSIPDDQEDLPEISLRVDGSYGVRDATGTTNARTREGSVRPVVRPPPHQFASQIPARTGPASRQAHSGASSSRQPQHRKLIPSAPRSTAAPVSCCLISGSHASSSNAGQRIDLRTQLEEVQRKLEQMSKENGDIQSALEEATKLRMKKEGEVTILRGAIEKSAKDHSMQLQKLKTEQDEATARYARLQKEMREEVERVKTQMVFQAQEQESSRRNFSSVLQSVRAKKNQSGSFAIPWNGQTPTLPRHSHAHQAPIPPLVFEKPQNATAAKNDALPGFQNTFTETAPPPTTHKPKNRVNQNGADHSAENHLTSSVSSHARSHMMLDIYADRAMEYETDDTFRTTQTYQDVHMSDTDEAPETGTQGLSPDDESGSDIDDDEMEIVEPLNLMAELSRSILSHSLPSTDILTIRALLTVDFQHTLPAELSRIYSTSCTRLIEVISNPSPFISIDYGVDRISDAFSRMVFVLRAAHLYSVLKPLFHLLTMLIYSFPQFPALILSRLHDTDSQFLVTLCGIISDQREMENKAYSDDLTAEILTLLDALCFRADDKTLDLLKYIPKNRQFWTSVLHNHQPTSTLALLIRFMITLASYRKLCRPLLSMPEPGEMETSEPAKHRLVDRICMLLVDQSRKDTKELKEEIITLFTLLSTSHRDVHVHLLSSTMVIPSVILYFSHLSTVFWEDNETILSATASEIASSLRSLNQILFFLNYLVVTSSSFLNLRQKIYSPQHWMFNGLVHHFVVTFARLSYSEAPDWMNKEQAAELLSMTDVAQEILDMVIDGPEADRAWMMYRAEADTVSETDEEEMEKKLLGDVA